MWSCVVYTAIVLSTALRFHVTHRIQIYSFLCEVFIRSIWERSLYSGAICGQNTGIYVCDQEYALVCIMLGLFRGVADLYPLLFSLTSGYAHGGIGWAMATALCYLISRTFFLDTMNAIDQCPHDFVRLRKCSSRLLTRHLHLAQSFSQSRR